MTAREDLISALEDGGWLDATADQLIDAYAAHVLRGTAWHLRNTPADQWRDTTDRETAARHVEQIAKEAQPSD